MNWFTTLFVFSLFAGTALQLWLSHRQARSVRVNRGQVPAAFSAHIPLGAHQKAADYTLARLVIERWEILYSALLVLLWTLGGGLNALAGLLASLDIPAPWAGVSLVLATLLLTSLLDLPTQVWRTFGVEQRFGFNRMTATAFLRDRLLGLLLMLLFGIPLLLAILWLMENAGSLWWLYAWAVWIGFSVLITWIFPIWIAPLFNRFEPLTDGPLRQRLEQLLERCGFHSSGMFVMDGSSRSSHGNAYFTGFGRNKRIVFYDTLLDGLEEPQVEAVLAHELGHFRHRHTLKLLALNALLSLVGLATLAWLMTQTWFYAGLGVAQSGPAVALTLFLLTAPVFTLFLSPLMSVLSRRYEFEADAFAARQASAQSLVDGLLNMYRDNASTLTPDRLYSAFHHSHPPAAERIAHLLHAGGPAQPAPQTQH